MRRSPTSPSGAPGTRRSPPPNSCRTARVSSACSPTRGYGPYVCQFIAAGTIQECAAQAFTSPDDDADDRRARHRVPLRRGAVADRRGGGRGRVGQVVGGADRGDLRRAVRPRDARLQQPLHPEPGRFRRVQLPDDVRRRPGEVVADRQPQHGGRRVHHHGRLREAPADAPARRDVRRHPGALDGSPGPGPRRPHGRGVRQPDRLRHGLVGRSRRPVASPTPAPTARCPGSTSRTATAPTS